MLELANTSLPNGLIPGTHGFATVAMTKGVPDALRIRLEAFCAYTHKSSAHDATYQSQNPVNWFHAILPQGEHVIGRVTASDFDYTGRTNRLARLLVLKPSEMPRCGAAAILAAERKRLSEPWSGEPRHLPEDVESARRITTLAVPLNPAPANWTALFGADGAVLAKRVAMQLKKNISDGRRPIYFKTSATFDQDGTRLLGLFSDVIGLLPQELRASVTFSTYPDALPGGTGCLLRGAFEGDKSFAAASATQSWIDCEAVRVVHAELLPEAKAQPTSEVQARGARQGVNAIPAWSANAQMTTQANAPKPSSHAAKAHGGKSASLVYSANGGASDRKFYAILVTCAAVVVAAFAVVAIIMLNNQRKERREEQQRLAEEKQREEEKQEQITKEQQAPTNREEERKRKDEEAKLAAERAKEAHQKKETEGQIENEKPKEMLALETKPIEEKGLTSLKDDRPAFYHAESLEFIEQMELNKQKFINDHPDMMVFYYGDESCAKMVDMKVEKQKLGFAVVYKPTPNKISSKGRFIIWYDADKKEAFWQWNLPQNAENGKSWYESCDCWDLWKEVFGSDANVGEFFELKAGNPTWTICQSKGKGESGIGETEREIRETGERSAQIDLFCPSSDEKEQMERSIQNEIDNYKNALDKRIKAIADEKKSCEEIRKKCNELKTIFAEIKSAKKAKEDAGKDKKKKSDADNRKRKAENKREELKDEIQKLFDKIGINVGSDFSSANDDKEIDNALKKYDDALNKVASAKPEEDSSVQEYNRNIAKLTEELKNFDEKFKQKWHREAQKAKYAIVGVEVEVKNQ